LYPNLKQTTEPLQDDLIKIGKVLVDEV